MSRRAVFNVSGKKFEVDQCSLLKIGTSKVQDMAQQSESEIFINRPSDSFEAILAYHQTGELHIPQNTCPCAFKTEIEFYGIESTNLAPCCFYKYSNFMNNQSTLEEFRQRAFPRNDIGEIDGSQKTRWRRFRSRIWRILDDHNSSVMAKVYFVASASLVLLSVFNLILSTLGSLHRPLNAVEKYEVLGYERASYGDDCVDLVSGWLHEKPMQGGEILNMNCSQLYTNLNNKTVTLDILWYIDVCLLCIFAVEFVIRIVFCPSLKEYFKCFVNVLDTVALIGSLSGILMNNIWSIQRYEWNEYDTISNLQVLRAVRLLRVIKNLDSSKVMSFVLVTGFSELSVMLSFLCVSVLIFSNLIFYLEDRETMPDILTGCWWSVVTMTTVGFGDIVPRSILGRILGMVCAVSGVVLIAVTIPIFVNTFVLVYNYAKLQSSVFSTKTTKRRSKDSYHKLTEES
ncbi:hypothetical protein ScPMuIL_011323 [Solemya velum]